MESREKQVLNYLIKMLEEFPDLEFPQHTSFVINHADHTTSYLFDKLTIKKLKERIESTQEQYVSRRRSWYHDEFGNSFPISKEPDGCYSMVNGDRVNVLKDVRTGEWITVSKEEMKKSVKDTNDKRKRERIESEMKKEYLFKDPQGYKEFHKPIVIKREEIPIKEEHEEKIKSLAKACRETQRNVYQNIVNKSFTGYEIEEIGEPELNEEAISKLCDDLIEAKKKPLSAAQIIDKYARRD